MALLRILLTLLIFCTCRLQAQQVFPVFVHYPDFSENEKTPYNGLNNFKSEDEKKQFIEQLAYNLQKDGFASAAIDSVKLKGDTTHVYVYKGNKYFFKSLSLHPDIRPFFKKDFITVSGRKNLFRFSNLNDDMERIVSEFEEIGYPFAKVFFDEVSLQNDSFSVVIHAEPGDLVTYDSLNNVNKARLTNSYLRAYTGIKIGKPYKESQVADIDALIDRLIFVERTAPSKVGFLEDKAFVNLYLKNRKMSRFDFILGLLPDPNRSNKMLVTGDIAIDLRNPFGIGNRLMLEWQRLDARSQKLQVFADYPFILGTPLGVETGLKMDKRDTLFLNVDWNVGIQYWLSGRNYFSFFIENSQTLVPKYDTVLIKLTKRLPSIQDKSSFLYGVKLLVDQLNYPINPSRGFYINASFGAGSRKIKQNILLEEISDGSGFNYNSLYDSIDLRSLKVNIRLQADYYYNISKKHVLKFGVNASSIINKELLFNELFRIGGNKLLRGFDEESLPVSTYCVGTIEYRFLLDKNAFFHIFADVAYLETRIDNLISKDNATGFGTGIAFETKAGIFGLSYALGRSKNIPLDPRNSKIHFGYINVF